ncbi:hypothetical protein Shal_0058 [Shewanella halifaxensis HAW-EB4]|uniref:Uncharacterized protein n=1 Tax=Shewanella halifaxensis (strain HAW-EB4) TaxID=458817 RepID=B0TM41_SHEHH|nr:hypothetical protein Shal_0058 [Shewanella halifaxensis HAW-EB4]
MRSQSFPAIPYCIDLMDGPFLECDESVINTNQYKDLVAQREFSGYEARQRVKSIVVLRLSSLTQHQSR